MSNNRVEVHVGAKTSELKKGMNDAESIVTNSVKKIESNNDGIKLNVDTSNLSSSLKKVTTDVQDSLSKTTESISKSLSEKFKSGLGETRIGSSLDGITSKFGLMRGGVVLAGAALTGLAVGGLAMAAVGLAKIATETARTNVELARSASLANSSIQDFQGLASAAQTFGFSQEKVADMMKDFNEKLGEFASVGSGGATDFFEKIAVKTEGGAEGAKKLAEQMAKMDGTTALQTYVEKLEEAGVNQQQMSFYLESMGSDLTALAPILQNGGKLWKDYQEALEEAGIITGQEAIDKSIELSAQTQTMQLKFNSLKSELSMAVMPVLSNLLSYFMNGTSVGGSFASMIQTIGTIARVVAVAVAGLASGVQNLVRLMSGAMKNMATLGSTAVNFASADGFLAKGRALVTGVKGIWSETRNTANDIITTSTSSLAGMSKIWNGGAAFDKLTQANINNQKAQLGFKGGKGGITSGIADNKELNPESKAAKAKVPKVKGPSDAERRAEQEAKAIAAIRYKYASEEKKIELDLQKALDEIDKSKLSSVEKAKFRVEAEKAASEKIKALHADQFDKIKTLKEEEIANNVLRAQRIYDIEKANLDNQLNAKKISNAQKVMLEKQFEDQLREIKRSALEERLDLENQYSAISGKKGDQGRIMNDMGDLDTDQTISDNKSTGLMNQAQMKDFEDKFGDLTGRISGLWDKSIQSMMNGTLTWQSATNAVFTDMGAYFLQTIVSEPLKAYMMGLSQRLAVRLGFIKTETAAEVMGQTAQTGAVVAGETAKTTATSVGTLARIGMKVMETIKSVMMSAWEAMAKTMASIPFPLNVGLGAAAFAGVAGIVGKVASARGGYDIPAGVNPVTQLHEEEMVLPKQHANTIRALGKSLTSDGGIAGGGGSSAQTFNNFTIQAWDSKDVRRFMEKHGRELAGGLKGYNRNFGR